jgi:dihydroneopterin aldolase
MFAKIGFEDLQVKCIIGDLEWERGEEQTLFLDLKVTAEISKCIPKDTLQGTCDYVALATLCKELAKTKKYQMLESLAVAIVQAIKEHPLVSHVFVRIKKPNGLPEAKWAFVEYEQ